jgi:hypothetical protein
LKKLHLEKTKQAIEYGDINYVVVFDGFDFVWTLFPHLAALVALPVY